jgi:two-component system chemotaxis response regulator CheB
MPRAAIELGAAREVLPLDRIASAIFTPAKAQLP